MASINYSAPQPPKFEGQNYPIWSIKMKAYLKAFGLWEVTQQEMVIVEPRDGATHNQRMAYENEVARGFKALTALHSSVSDSIFTRIMSCETAKHVWDKLQEEYQGNTRTRQMQILNLRRAFETLKMKDNELVKDFSDRLMKIVNEIKVLGEPLSDQRIVEKVLVSLPEKFEAKISSLEESRDLSQISLSELINALQATEQRRSIRKEESLENAYVIKGKNNNKNYGASSSRSQQKYPPCKYCKKNGHAPTKCFWRPDAFCTRCGLKGHIDRVCKQQQQQQPQQQ